MRVGSESFQKTRLPSGAVAAAGLAAALAPLVLLIANRDWFFTPEGFLDPWQYVGFFRWYQDLDYSPEDYKLARLPWILAGHDITISLPAIPAAYTLHAIFLCALPLTFFGATYTLLRRSSRAALLALCLSGPLFLATLWIAVLPSSLRGNAGALTFTGVMAALTAHANLTLVNLFPVLLHLRVVRCDSARWDIRSGRCRR